MRQGQNNPPASGDPARIALYGGAFDPVHNAHLAVARAVLDEGAVDQVRFIPAARSPLKASGPRAGDEARLTMLRLATADEPRFLVDPVELERGGVSYTVDTVRYFREQLPNKSLFWIIGGDQFELLDRWRAIEALAAMVHFLVIARPGARIGASSVAGLRYRVVTAPLMDESSSEIRRRLAEGRSVADLVPPPVEAFISSREIYTGDD